MADTAYQTVYRDEWIKGFERDQAVLRMTVTTEAMIKGRQAVFLVANTNREAVTRGSNGLIPATVDDLSQNTCTLAEAHDLPQKTGFNIFAGQSNQREIMQAMSRGVINRHIDDTIIAAVAEGTVDANNTAQIMTKGLINKATTILWNNEVPNDGNVWGLLTPAAWAHMSDIKGFSSADYVEMKPLPEGAPTSQRGPEVRRWMGVNWIMHERLPGVGTSSAECYLYHRNAVGHAYDADDVQVFAGYNEEQDYSWARTTIYHGAVKLQNTGIVVIKHDDTKL